MQSSVILTGASRGIGLETTKVLIQRGYHVYGLSRTKATFSNELLTPITCDITDSLSVDKAMRLIHDDMKSRDIKLSALINNAGYAQIGSIEDVPVDLVRRQFETNVFAMLDITRRLIPLFKSQKEGKIINVSSVVGLFTGPFGGIYSATKHSMEALSVSMRMELRRYGVKVIVVNPGLTETDFHKVAFATLNLFKENSEYKNWYQGYMRRHTNGMPVRVVARAISKIVADPRPKPRYVVGNRERLVLFLRKSLPERTFYSLVEKKSYED